MHWQRAGGGQQVTLEEIAELPGFFTLKYAHISSSLFSSFLRCRATDSFVSPGISAMSMVTM
jgi:hypothetical protein